MVDDQVVPVRRDSGVTRGPQSPNEVQPALKVSSEFTSTVVLHVPELGSLSEMPKSGTGCSTLATKQRYDNHVKRPSAPGLMRVPSRPPSQSR